jgi:hypothetical protein
MKQDYLSQIIPLARQALLFAAVLLIGAFLLVALMKLLSYIRVLRQKSVYLELTPPAFMDRTPQATEKFFAALHSIGMSRSLGDRIGQQITSFALEIVSTKTKGIRFLLRVSPDKAEILEHTITAYLPEVRVQQVADYVPATRDKTIRIMTFKQAEHFAYPLQGQEELESHDPIAYLTNAMTKLEDNEVLALQIVIRPLRVPAAEALGRKILHNEDLLPKLNRSGGTFLPLLFRGINNMAFSLLDAVGEGFHGTSKTAYHGAQKELEYEKQVARNIKPARTLSYFEHQLIESINQKLSQPLFRTELRALVVTSSKQERIKRQKSIESALAVLAVPNYQSLKWQRYHGALLKKYQLFRYRKRLPAVLGKSNLFATTELANLYHFPHSASGKTDNIITAVSRTLPAPVSLKNGTELDILLGQNTHHGTTTAIGLTEAERERHLYVIGGTGNGKTTMLQYGIVQDMQSGKGLAVVDPHGDMAQTLLRHVPEDRLQDVIYFNPDDLDYPIGLNLLELTPDLTGNALLRERDLVTESVVSVFRKIFSDDDSGGHRIEYVLRNAVHTALTVEGATLFTVLKLLQNSTYRRKIVDTLTDPGLKDFWKQEFGQAGNMQRVKMSSGVTHKIGRFERSAAATQILGQAKSTIDFDDIINSGKILICNVSKGLLGEDVSELFGITILAKLQLASLRRARLEQEDRQSFYLYVDEFQNFATMSFVQMLSEARKYKLFLTMAEQSTAQQEQQRMVDIILANVGTVICFRSGSPADEQRILPLFSPYIQEGEIANLPTYTFYARIAAIQAQEPLSGTTVLLDSKGNKAIAQQVIDNSREMYGGVAPVLIVESRTDEPESVESDKPKGRRKRGSTKNKGAPRRKPA